MTTGMEVEEVWGGEGLEAGDEVGEAGDVGHPEGEEEAEAQTSKCSSS